MFNLTDLFGREGMAGLTIYLLAAYIAAGPLSERYVDKHLLPACRAGAVTGRSAAPPWKTPADLLKDRLRRQGEIGRGLADLADLVGALTSESTSSNSTSAGSCECRAEAILGRSDVRINWAIFVASWKLVDMATASTATMIATADTPACKWGR